MIDLRTGFEIVAGLVMILLGVISWFLREKAQDNDRKLADHERRLHEVELRDAAGAVEIRQLAQGLAMIGELRAEMALRYCTREDIANLMGQLERHSHALGRLREDLARSEGARGAVLRAEEDAG